MSKRRRAVVVPLEPEEGDPIGDALREAAVAYWKLDEGTQPYVDSVGDADLIETEDVPPFASIVGIIHNAVGYTDSPGGGHSLYSITPIGTLTSWSLSCWVKTNNTTDAGDSADLINYPNDVRLAVEDNNSLFIYLPGQGQSSDYPVNASAWHHVVVISNGTSHKFYIDDVLVETYSATETPTAFYPLNWLLTGGWNTIDTYYLDEIGLFNIQITAEKIAYLYNAGAGRTLYP